MKIYYNQKIAEYHDFKKLNVQLSLVEDSQEVITSYFGTRDQLFHVALQHIGISPSGKLTPSTKEMAHYFTHGH